MYHTMRFTLEKERRENHLREIHLLPKFARCTEDSNSMVGMVSSTKIHSSLPQTPCKAKLVKSMFNISQRAFLCTKRRSGIAHLSLRLIHRGKNSNFQYQGPRYVSKMPTTKSHFGPSQDFLSKHRVRSYALTFAKQYLDDCHGTRH